MNPSNDEIRAFCRRTPPPFDGITSKRATGREKVEETEVPMLVLSRRRSETLLLGAGVRITVLKVERNSVRLGIEAPEDVSIVRTELLEACSTKPASRPTPARFSAG